METRQQVSRVALALVLGALSNANAASVVLDYNNLPFDRFVPAIVEDGFRTSATGSGMYSLIGMVTAGSAGAEVTIAAVDASPFSLSSIDFRLFDVGSYAFTVFGDLVDGGTVTQQISGLSTRMHTVAFGAGFTNLLAVRFLQGPTIFGDDDVIFDNVRIQTAVVPEPATLGLAGLALAAASAMRRRRRG